MGSIYRLQHQYYAILLHSTNIKDFYFIFVELHKKNIKKKFIKIHLDFFQKLFSLLYFPNDCTQTQTHKHLHLLIYEYATWLEKESQKRTNGQSAGM